MTSLLNKILKTLKNLCDKDSVEWIEGTLSDNFTVYDSSSNSTFKYTKVGNIGGIRGVITPSDTLEGGTSDHEIGTIPEGYRPYANQYFLCQGSGKYTWLLKITYDGIVSMQRYGNSSGYSDCKNGTWLPFCVTWIIGR